MRIEYKTEQPSNETIPEPLTAKHVQKDLDANNINARVTVKGENITIHSTEPLTEQERTIVQNLITSYENNDNLIIGQVQQQRVIND